MSRSVLTDSPYDRALLGEVRPDTWKNPEPRERYHLVVVGAGTAGLVSAAGAAGLGARVALVERNLLGGDCLNVGCVPSKAVISSARAVAAARRAGELGVRVEGEVEADFPAVMERMRKLRASIAPHDGARRFRDLGIDVFLGEGRFVGRDAVEVGGRRLRFARAVVATGGRAWIPPVPGLEEAGFRTNESIFNLTALPARLAVVGGGPIGSELAQTFARLGSQVTLLQRDPQLLLREDADAAALLLEAFREEGIDVRLGATLVRVTRGAAGRRLEVERDGKLEAVEVDEILIAAGRRPNVEGLGLEAAGVAYGDRGVEIDDFLRTSNRRVFAAGDVALRYQFTHVADAAARIVIQNALFPTKRRVGRLTVPWSTYTDPEIAHVGLTGHDAEARGIAHETLTLPFAEVDRAILAGDTRGFARLYVEPKRGKILGATIVGAEAGELISEVSVAMAGGVTLGALAGVIHPYPTRAEILRKAGDVWNRRRLTPTARRVLGALLRTVR